MASESTAEGLTVGLPEHRGTVRVTVSPQQVRPRQSVTATVSTDDPVTKVTSARLEWGYDNFYRYLRAGSPAAGDERQADSWVCVSRVDLPLGTAEFGTATDTFKVPSWAPGSSSQIARWGCRLVVEQDHGGDIDVTGEFEVRIGAADVDSGDEPLERLSGDGTPGVGLILNSSLYRDGEDIAGEVTLRPGQDLPPAEVTVHWQREWESHPLMHPAAPESVEDGRFIQLGKDIALRTGIGVRLPFALTLPTDAAPTAAAVHSSLAWFVTVRIVYTDPSGQPPEQVRKRIVVINAA